MKSTLELASDSLRSSVSSPGIPKTYLTPSTSRHSTNRSDALRSIARNFSPPLCRANVAVHRLSMRARTLLIALLALLCLLPGGQRRRGLVEVHDPRRRLRARRRDEPVRRLRLRAATARATATSSPTTTRAPRSGRSTRTGACGCCCSRCGARLVHRRDARRPAPRCRRARPTTCAAAARAVQLRSSRRQALGTYTRAARDRPRRHGDAARARGQRARQRRLPRRDRLQPGRVLGRRRDQRALARHLPARRGAGRVAAVVAARGAQGAGRRGAHLRDRDHEAGRRLRPLPRHALAGLRRRGGRGGLDQRGDRRRRAARS